MRNLFENAKMKRRTFFKTTLVGGAALTVGATLGGRYSLLEPTKKVSAQSSSNVPAILSTDQQFTVKTGGGVFNATVRNGTIIRIEPLQYGGAKAWSFTTKGQTFTPPTKSLARNNWMAYKRYIYNPNRLGYPMMRADFVAGQGGKTAASRANANFVRVTWD